MKQTLSLAAFVGAVALAGGAMAASHAGDWTKSPFGPDDEAGRSNLMTPAKALEAEKVRVRAEAKKKRGR